MSYDAKGAARKSLEKLERFGQQEEFTATISSDGVCFSESNLGILESALTAAFNAGIEAASQAVEKHCGGCIGEMTGKGCALAEDARALKKPAPEGR
jgi:hypothetical protein